MVDFILLNHPPGIRLTGRKAILEAYPGQFGGLLKVRYGGGEESIVAFLYHSPFYFLPVFSSNMKISADGSF